MCLSWLKGLKSCKLCRKKRKPSERRAFLLYAFTNNSNVQTLVVAVYRHPAESQAVPRRRTRAASAAAASSAASRACAAAGAGVADGAVAFDVAAAGALRRPLAKGWKDGDLAVAGVDDGADNGRAVVALAVGAIIPDAGSGAFLSALPSNRYQIAVGADYGRASRLAVSYTFFRCIRSWYASSSILTLRLRGILDRTSR